MDISSFQRNLEFAFLVSGETRRIMHLRRWEKTQHVPFTSRFAVLATQEYCGSVTASHWHAYGAAKRFSDTAECTRTCSMYTYVVTRTGIISFCVEHRQCV